jgi:hypothetical protein
MKNILFSALIAALLVVCCTAPAMAQLTRSTVNHDDAVVLSFKAGYSNGSSDYVGKHLLLGGGLRLYPFKPKILRKTGFGFELGRSVMQSQEGYDENLGSYRFQDRLWLMDIGPWQNIVKMKHFSLDVFGGGTWARKTQVLQVPYYNSWVDIKQFGYDCPICQSESKLLYHYGAQASFLLPVARDYAGDTKISFGLPEIRYTRYSNGMKAFSVGLEAHFGR